VSRSLKLAGQGLALAAVAGLLALLVWKVVHQDRNTAASEIAHGRAAAAPHFVLPRLDREGTLALGSLRGKAVVLNFWASWCGPCKEEVPALESTWKRYRDRGLVVVGVDVQDFSTDAKRFARRYGVTYPIVRDKGKTFDSYGLTGVPETFFVNRSGRLVAEHIEGGVHLGRNQDKFERGLELALSS
jgi:cytochrome c biogenesis protein CcmG/thiol:disulfide interchange protein DsbE